MTTELSIFSNVPTNNDDKAFELAAGSGKYLPYLQFMTSNSEDCKEGKFPINHYAFVVNSTKHDIGQEVDVIVCGWRSKAARIKGDDIVSVYDVKHPLFAVLQAESEVKDSGAMYGVEFLIWLPSQKKFATLFMGSKSARKEAPNVRGYMHKSCTLKWKMIETAKYKWAAIAAHPCSAQLELPEEEALRTVIDQFNNPPAAPEMAEQASDRAR